MPYETPITVKQALQRIEQTEYVLPAIQREFVWGHERIVRLFDSLMRGYPIGGFLLWSLSRETVERLDLYQFLDRYNEFDHRHNERLALPEPRPLFAVLDGQQRLTGLNVALRGTYAYRLPRRWADRPDNYPKRVLCLELCGLVGEEEEPELEGVAGEGLRYRFEFLRPEEAQERNSESEHWYPVPEILKDEPIAQQLSLLQAGGLVGEPLNQAVDTLDRLRNMVHTDLAIAAHVEEDQSLDRVLDIFIRVNSGGVTLSSSDLLLSIATARWKERDARESIHSLVDELNAIGNGFAFSKDHVLKAALVLTDAGDIRFKASNINPNTMARVEQEWDRIANSLRLAVEALSRFGFNQQTLTAHSAAIPIADYFHHRGLDSSWLSSVTYRDDRALMRRWVVKSLVKAGVWGAGLDSLLVALRKSVRDAHTMGFPITGLESALAARGKELSFSDEEIDALSATVIGRRAFAVLALLYPGFDGTKEFHIDHVFPSALFRRKELAAAGLDAEHVEECIERRDTLANLQLLEGSVNVSKQATMPGRWIESHFADDASRQAYLAAHDLTGLPDTLLGFLDFAEVRRKRLRKRLASELGVGTSDSD